MISEIRIQCDKCHKDLITFRLEKWGNAIINDYFDVICHGCRDTIKRNEDNKRIRQQA